MSDERDDRGEEVTNRLSQRFGDDATETESAAESGQSATTDDSSQSSKTDETAKTDKPDKSDVAEGITEDDSGTAAAGSGDTEPIKDRPSVLMYLPEDLHRELDLRFDELNLKHKREHGEPLEKNRDFYPAVVKAALEGKEIQDILEHKD